MKYDLWGKALIDYYHGHRDHSLILHTSYGPPETVPLDVFFRDKTNLSDLEVFACDLCQDTVLDVGAGTGCHSRILQEAGHKVTALEKSPGACEVMQLSGIKEVARQDLHHFRKNGFHTALMLMNGLGLAGTLDNLPNLLSSVFSKLNSNGQIIADSSDIAYLYEDNNLPATKYYGELEYCYEYRNQRDASFPWLFVDIDRLKHTVNDLGLKVQLVFEANDQYLVRITR